MNKLTLSNDHPHKNGRTCTKCNTFKLASEYVLSRNKRSLGGVHMRADCKVCMEHRKYKAFIKRTYGITYEEYTNLLEKQNYSCSICDSEVSNLKFTKLCVDHDHKTGKVRGLLCSKCNHGLGLFNDDTSLLNKAIKYLTPDEN